MRIRIDDFEQILIDFKIIGSFFANGALPTLGREPTGNIRIDEAFEIEGLVMRSAMFGSYWDSDFICIKMAVQWYL